MTTEPLIDPPAAVRHADDLADLLASAAAEHEAGKRAERLSLEHYRRCGEQLARAKEAAGHGNWAEALKKTGIPQQRASEYMRLAHGWAELPPGGDFALKEALRLIAGVVGGEGAVRMLPPQPADPAEVMIVDSVEDGMAVMRFNYGSSGVRWRSATECEAIGEPTPKEFTWLLQHMMYLGLALPDEMPESERPAARAEINRAFWSLLKVAKLALTRESRDNVPLDSSPHRHGADNGEVSES